MNFNEFLSGRPANDYVFQKMDYNEQIGKAADLLQEADVVLIGAGAGLSTAAGLTYGGKRFTDNFQEYIDKYGSMYMTDMYSAGFFPFPTGEAKWGYWAKHSYINRIEPEGLPVYKAVYKLVEHKEHFVLTTNVDHQFEKSGFEEDNIFATQGDYGLIQCAKGCHQKTYDAIESFKQMVPATKDCKIPSHMVPKCPVCGGVMVMNLRCDQYFVEDEHWHEQDEKFGAFLTDNMDKKMVLFELGVGFNTPTIIRFPFENLLREHENISLIRLNLNEAVVPESFENRAIGINEDIGKVLSDIYVNIEKGK
ncbi:MAG: Sir2 silent information regulator family NAD-dependent deacetylase [Lachnospiraceae bacterium]|nr:Sir2 silent information regulator family NAD-dependent deacetylase [Lachnospiraceae bacterium]